LQHYLSIVRGVMLKGAGLDELWPHVVALILLSLGMGFVALRSVSRRLE
ncbi:MAG: ABC transporter permease, partial [Anaerolineae bacterium]|nr:ABC transporter permease [Anaerolineae bacterium]